MVAALPRRGANERGQQGALEKNTPPKKGVGRVEEEEEGFVDTG